MPSKEDIPTFDEWKKQVMEVEKEKSKRHDARMHACMLAHTHAHIHVFVFLNVMNI